jgi:hypothetical protein
MDRLAGAISSVIEDAFDFDLVWRDGASSSSLVGGRSLSCSESDVIADVEAVDGDRCGGLFGLDCEMLERPLLGLPFSLTSEDPVDPDGTAASFRFRRLRLREIL